MCHSIIWYHVLCGHTDHSMSTIIYCDEAILSGEDCLPYVDRIDFPMIGACDSCMTERRRLKASRSQEMQASASHARPTRTDASEAATTDTDSRVHIAKSHGCGIRYNGWRDEETDENQQLHGLGLAITPTNEIVKEWLNNPVSPVSPSAETSFSWDDAPRRLEFTSHSRGSYIPVPVRMLHAGNQTRAQPKSQRSRIPAPAKMLLKPTKRESNRPSDTDEGDGSFASKMALFDRVTF